MLHSVNYRKNCLVVRVGLTTISPQFLFQAVSYLWCITLGTSGLDFRSLKYLCSLKLMQFLICSWNLHLRLLPICETNYTLSLSFQGINFLVQKLSVNVYFIIWYWNRFLVSVTLKCCLQPRNRWTFTCWVQPVTKYNAPCCVFDKPALCCLKFLPHDSKDCYHSCTCMARCVSVVHQIFLFLGFVLWGKIKVAMCVELWVESIPMGCSWVWAMCNEKDWMVKETDLENCFCNYILDE